MRLLKIFLNIVVNIFNNFMRKIFRRNYIFWSSKSLKDTLLDLQFEKMVSKSLKKKLKIYLLGTDFVNGSIDKDRENVKYFLKKIDYRITGNIFEATHLYCVWADFLLDKCYLILILKNLIKFKIIANVTNDIRYYRKNIKKLSRIVDIWVAPSKRIYNYLFQLNLNVNLIPFYVPVKIFKKIKLNKKEIAEKLKLDYNKIKNKTVICTFQRDSTGSNLLKPKWQKNPDLLISILKNLPKNRFILLLAGPRRHYIINQCEINNIPFLYYGNFWYIRKQKDDILINNHPLDIINLLYNISDISLISSKIEGGPKAILEASLTKTLVFSTDVGLAKDFIHEDLIFSEKNIDKVIRFMIDFNKKEDVIKKYVEYNYNQVNRVLDEKNYKKLFEDLLKIKK